MVGVEENGHLGADLEERDQAGHGLLADEGEQHARDRDHSPKPFHKEIRLISRFRDAPRTALEGIIGAKPSLALPVRDRRSYPSAQREGCQG